jgi:hypothetical protein
MTTDCNSGDDPFIGLDITKLSPRDDIAPLIFVYLEQNYPTIRPDMHYRISLVLIAQNKISVEAIRDLANVITSGNHTPSDPDEYCHSLFMNQVETEFPSIQGEPLVRILMDVMLAYARGDERFDACVDALCVLSKPIVSSKGE